MICMFIKKLSAPLFPLCSSVIRRLDSFLRLPLAGGPGYFDRFSHLVGNLHYYLRSQMKYDRHFSYWILNPCSQPALGDFPFFCCNHFTNLILDLVVSLRYLSTWLGRFLLGTADSTMDLPSKIIRYKISVCTIL